MCRTFIFTFTFPPKHLYSSINTVTGSCKVMDGCSLALCSATVSVVSAGICHINEVSSIA